MVTVPAEPAVERRRLRAELKQARLRAERTQRDVAAAMDWSASKLIRIESGEVRITRNDLKALLEYYGITEPDRVAALLEMARVAREDEPWSDFLDILTKTNVKFLGFESSAARIRAFQPLLVPGLLQTEEYASAVLADMYGVPEATIGRAWAVRQRRQRLHERDTPPLMEFVIDEAVIRRPVGGARVMRRQLDLLLEYAGHDHVTLQVAPFRAGAHPGMLARFVLLEFADPTDDDVLFLEEPDYLLREDPGEVGQYLDRFFRLQELALSPERSVELVADARREMDRLAGAEPQPAGVVPANR